MNEFTPVWNAINASFWPAIFDSAISQQDQLLFSIPVKMGGMGIRNPVDMANIAHITSVSGTRHISDAIKERKPLSLVDHNAKMAEAISTMHHELQQQDQKKLDSVLSTLDTKQVRAIQRAITFKTSSWLTVLPTTYHHFDLSVTEFRDALTVRYHQPLLKMPVTCDGCGATFSYEHALDCKKKGLVTRRHNEEILLVICHLLFTRTSSGNQ